MYILYIYLVFDRRKVSCNKYQSSNCNIHICVTLWDTLHQKVQLSQIRKYNSMFCRSNLYIATCSVISILHCQPLCTFSKSIYFLLMFPNYFSIQKRETTQKNSYIFNAKEIKFDLELFLPFPNTITQLSLLSNFGILGQELTVCHIVKAQKFNLI